MMTMQENERVERRVPIDEIALQQEIPKQGHQEGDDDFRQEEKVGRTVCTQRGCPRRAHHDFGEQIRSVSVEKNTACPHHGILYRHESFGTAGGAEYPPIIEAAVEHAADYRPEKCRCYIIEMTNVCQQKGGQEIDQP